MENREYIRRRIIERIPQKQPMFTAQAVTPTPLRAAPKKTVINGGPSFATKFLASCILMVFVAMTALLMSKHMDFNPFANNNSQVAVRTPNKPADPVRQQIVREQYDDSELNTKLAELERQQQVWQHRVWLLALAHNENANINQRIDNGFHPNSNAKFLMFTEDWSFNKYPETLVIPDSLKDKIQVK